MTYHRDTLVKELMEHVHIEARGKCLNNAPRFEGNYGMGHKLNYVSARVAAVDCLCAVLPRCSGRLRVEGEGQPLRAGCRGNVR